MIYERLRAAGLAVRDERVPGYKNLSYRAQYTCLHHTAASGTADLPSLNVCKYGRADLPGPLCQLLVGRRGTIVSITDGYGNHAGRVVEPYSNYSLVGIELENNGVGEPYPEVQLQATRDVCHALGFPVVVGHKEICVPTGRKIDPSFNMDAFRASLYVPEDDMTPAQAAQLENVTFLANQMNHIIVNALTADGKQPYGPGVLGAAPPAPVIPVPPSAAQIADAVIAKLPPAQSGGITPAQVTEAVKAALRSGTGS